jgi:hypothetical protein
MSSTRVKALAKVAKPPSSLPQSMIAQPLTPPIEAIEWMKAQREEQGYWGSCGNSYTEETKQFIYMRKMGFTCIQTANSAHSFDAGGKTILDVGGGPVSVLLKFINLQRGKVIDPCPYPNWVGMRYEAAGIEYSRQLAEEMDESGWDVCLLYNVLQHTVDPEKIVKKCVAAAKEFHCFEWIEIPPHPGHPHCLLAKQLQAWSGKQGDVATFHGVNECFGKAWSC